MNLYRKLLKFSLRLHNFSYKLATKISLKVENGIHPKHRLMNYHKFFVDNIKIGDKVLDVGCGNGALAYDLSKKAKTVVAIDLNTENIKKAKQKYNSSNIEYIIGDAVNYNFNPQDFDVIVLSNVLEHINNRIEFLKKLRKIAPKILIRVPMIDRDWITLYKRELNIEYRLDKTHFIEYTLESFINELRKAGLKLKTYSIQFGEIWAVVK